MKYLEIKDYYPYPIKKRYSGIVGEHKGIKWILKKNLRQYESIFIRFLEYKRCSPEIKINTTKAMTKT